MSSSATAKQPGCDVLVVVCDASCFTAVSEMLADVRERKFSSGTVFDQGRITDESEQPVQVAVVQAEAGQVAALTNQCLEALRPAYTFFLHLAAAIDPQVRLGDIVFANKIYAFEFGEQGKNFRATPEGGRPANRLVQRAMSVARKLEWLEHVNPKLRDDDAPTAHIEPVASGRTQIHRQAPDLGVLRDNYNDALATLWGGEDFVAAAHIEHAEAALICGISRELTVGGAAESRASVASAARTTAAFARTMIEKLGARPDGRPREPEVEPPIDEVDERRRQLAQRLDELMRMQDRELRRPLPEARLAEIEAEIRAVRGTLRSGPGLCAGEFLRGRYHLIKVLGEGGFATVWHAYDRIDKENVAVKVLHPNHGENLEIRDRFFRGARQMARLAGGGAVRVKNTGESDHGYHYFAMELVEGSFREAIETLQIPMRDRVRWVAEVAHTLAMAHEDGVVHRDIRPENILLDDRLRARLTDFDLVQLPKATRYTKPASMGDYIYAAPEQLRSASQASPCSDVYSLGMVLVFALLGTHPEPGLVQKDRYDFISKLRCPPALKVILARSLGYDPRDRYYAHAGDFERDLVRALANSDWRELESSDERAWRERAAKLLWLEQAPEDDFSTLVEQVTQQTAWLPGYGSRRGLALELFQEIEYGNLDQYHGLPEAPLPALPRDIRSIDWESAFDTFCWADPDAFEAFLYLTGIRKHIIGGRAAQSVRAGQAVDVLVDPALTDAFTTAALFFCFFPPSHPGRDIHDANWRRLKARWILDRMTSILLSPLRAHFESLLGTRDQSGIADALTDPKHWESEELGLTPVVARVKHAVASVDGEIFYKIDRKIEVSRFALYRELCRLSPTKFTGLCNQLVPLCALPTANQAWCALELAEVHLGRVCAYLADHAMPVPPVELEFKGMPLDDPSYQLLSIAPELIFQEMLLALRLSLSRTTGRERQIAQIYELGELRAADAMRWLRQDLLKACALPQSSGLTVGLWEQPGFVHTALTRLPVDKVFLIRDALRLPPWMAVPAGTSQRDAAYELGHLLAWLALPGWSEAVAGSGGDAKSMIRWIAALRADGGSDGPSSGANPPEGAAA